MAFPSCMRVESDFESEPAGVILNNKGEGMRGRAELLIPLSWMLFYRSCGVAASGRSPLSECAQLLMWLLGLSRVREARREEATTGKARQCQALSLEKCPSLGQSFHCCLSTLVIPVLEYFLCLLIICLCVSVCITLWASPHYILPLSPLSYLRVHGRYSRNVCWRRESLWSLSAVQCTDQPNCSVNL